MIGWEGGEKGDWGIGPSGRGYRRSRVMRVLGWRTQLFTNSACPNFWKFHFLFIYIFVTHGYFKRLLLLL